MFNKILKKYALFDSYFANRHQKVPKIGKGLKKYIYIFLSTITY